MIPYETFPSAHMRDGIERWIERGLMGGGFFRALITGNLQDALGRADMINRQNLPRMVQWLQAHAPADCWGSAEKAETWQAHRGLEGPLEAPTDTGLPRIFVFCNSCQPEWHTALALAEDGTCLGQHVCSSHGWILHDLGVNEDGARRDDYAKHYPDGFVVEFVEDPANHDGIAAAYKLNQERKEEADASS